MSQSELPPGARTVDPPGGRAIPAIAIGLGYAGLLPQALALALVLFGGPAWRFTGLSLAFAYAALIFSFLGGVWWGLAARSDKTLPRWVWLASVAPALLSLASAWPWATGDEWPGPSLLALGLAIALSVIVDVRLRQLELTPPRWLMLRLPLSLGLGSLTFAIGLGAAFSG
ncbi:DUF3429 domain-containing protein [Brevundimonas sp. TWP2-3-4b2]|uniref:DUF3429 domain-containing protein n=1 Tax=Brevundimonas sp. TWP2-3-4b2 TaxID=2804595 RepID=UPI003CE75FCE